MTATLSTDALQVYNPARPAEVVGSARLAGPGEVSALIDRAAAAQSGWAALAVAERIALVQSALAGLGGPEGLEELATLLCRENGKVIAEARVDVGGLAGMVGATAAFASVLAPRTVDGPGTRLVQRRRPLGVVALLVPFNAPVVLAAAQLAPALIAGNTAVVKAPLPCPLALTEVVRRFGAGLPEGVLSATVATDADAGVLLRDPRVRKIGLTGGSRTALAVLHGLGDVKDVLFELGGNDPHLVLDDATIDDDMARRLAAGALSLSGQYCAAVKRIYVHRSRAAELAGALEAVYREVVVGDGLDPATGLGPVIDRRAVDRAAALRADAEARGARAVAGGLVPDEDLVSRGYFVRPTLLLEATQDSAVVREEQFCPLLPIVPVGSDEEAVAMANDSRFGLAAGVWSADLERAGSVADRLAGGIAVVNGTPNDTKDIRAPFGGTDQSGIGRTLADEGLRSFSAEHTRVIALR